VDEFSLGRVKKGLDSGLRLLVPAVEMTRLDLAVREDGTWRIGVCHSFQDGRTTTVASVEKGANRQGDFRSCHGVTATEERLS